MNKLTEEQKELVRELVNLRQLAEEMVGMEDRIEAIEQKLGLNDGN